MIYFLTGFAVLTVAIYVLNTVMIRTHFHFTTQKSVPDALDAAQGAVGGTTDDDSRLHVPLGRGRIMSVIAASEADGTHVEVWLSTYDFASAGPIQFLRYRALAMKVKDACQATQRTKS